MSRLLFAAARSARIEESWQDEWEPADLNHVFDADYYRIHTDDEHLQYGPISTALREFVLSEGSPWSREIDAAFAYVNFFWPRWNDWLYGVDYGTAILFMAEYLADEGL